MSHDHIHWLVTPSPANGRQRCDSTSETAKRLLSKNLVRDVLLIDWKEVVLLKHLRRLHIRIISPLYGSNPTCLTLKHDRHLDRAFQWWLIAIERQADRLAYHELYKHSSLAYWNWAEYHSAMTSNVYLQSWCQTPET